MWCIGDDGLLEVTLAKASCLHRAVQRLETIINWFHHLTEREVYELSTLNDPDVVQYGTRTHRRLRIVVDRVQELLLLS